MLTVCFQLIELSELALYGSGYGPVLVGAKRAHVEPAAELGAGHKVVGRGLEEQEILPLFCGIALGAAGGVLR